MNLVQANIALGKADLDSEIMKSFVNNIDRINAIADEAPGFIWRYQDDPDGNGGALETKILDNPLLIFNMSMWQDVNSLKSFVYRTAHRDIMKRREEWMDALDTQHLVMWWLDDDAHMPSVADALERFEHLNTNGPSDFAFNWHFLNQ